MICKNCGATLGDSAKFCVTCGAKVEQTPGSATDKAPVYAGQASAPVQPPQQPYQPQPQPYQQPRQAYRPQPQPYQPAPAQKKKGHGGIIAIAVVVVVLIAAALTYFVWKPAFLFGDGGTTVKTTDSGGVNTNAGVNTNGGVNTNNGAAQTITYSYLSAKLTPVVSYTAETKIYPSLYRTLDSLVTLTGYCQNGECDVMVTVEIPGFTQQYKQQVHLSSEITKLRIIPPLLTGDLGLNSEKAAQLVVSVTDTDTGKTLIQDSKDITLASKYDMIWWTPEYGDMNTDNILAWLTPESPGVLQLKRDAIDYLDYVSGGYVNAFVGYQDYGIFNDVMWNTWLQAVALMGAMSDVDQIRYNNAAFSIDSEAAQRVLLPDDVMNSRSGICIETSLLMASALQSAGFHCMLVFPPGHAQVAVETWPNSGEYFLIETTILPMDMDEDAWDNTVMYLSQDEWWGYLDGTGYYTNGPCYVVDCDLGMKLGITAMSN